MRPMPSRPAGAGPLLGGPAGGAGAALVVMLAVAVAARLDDCACALTILALLNDLGKGGAGVLFAAGEIESLAEFGVHQIGVRRLVPSVIPIGGRLVMRQRQFILPLSEIDIAERIVRGGSADLIACVGELFERRLEKRQRLIGAVAAQERQPLLERSLGLCACLVRLCRRRVCFTCAERGEQ